MKTYEQERDEAAYEYNHFIHERLGFKAGADWANARAEKVIAEKAAEQRQFLSLTASAINSLKDKLTSRDAMIEKLREAIIWYTVYADEIVLEHYGGKEISKKSKAKEALAELNEWRKQND